ncbi:unnamed protein product [Aureobasidium pullulans]|nr:unnamed protein product [Aureobasidium pullulans]
MGVLPMAVFGLEVPAGGMPVAASGDIPAAPEFDEDTKGKKPRATLKIIRAPLQMDEEDDSDFDPEEMDMMLASDEEESEEEAGPSDPTKSKKARKAAAAKQLREELESMDVDSPKVKGKGKVQADDEEESDEDDEDDEDDEEFEPEEFVLCTLDPENQTLDITVGDDERVWFMVTGTHDVYLTGNYVEPDHTHGPEGEYDSEDEDDEDEYDLSPDEDELYGDEDSEDELDDMENPRITEVDEEEAPALVPVKADKKADKKGKNKRAADEEAESLDDLISKAKPAEKKNAKKVKTNEGKAVPADEVAKKVETPASAKSDKKPAEKSKAAPTVKTVNGVTIDDKKIGSGPAAKKGDRIGMRYIGKLQNGKVFDSNKKGKPFSFKLGTGEVIKGWDIGIAGMQVGGERRVTVPAHHAYGSQSLPGIPKNSTLIFDVKCVEIK